jgi:glycerol transport system ATP-binding protein
MGMSEITLNNLAHSYLDDPQSEKDYALHALQHTWKQGGAYALLGPSGCGKSTLLNIISGLLQPTEGQVLFDGVEVNQLLPQERNIAQVFQFPVVYDGMTVFDNLAFPLRNIKMSKSQIVKKVNEIAELMELTDVLKKKANNLAADQKQKISMARGLVREDVSAILFDEPLTVIDPHLKWKLRRKLKQIHEKLNITMLYVTHDQLEAATFADEIAVMYQGKIVQFGTPQSLFEQPNHTFVGYFIGSPGMNFIPVEWNGSQCTFADHVVQLTDRQQDALRLTKSDNIKIGIRPEYVQLATPKDDVERVFSATCMHIEDYGTYVLATLDIGGFSVMMRAEESECIQADGVSVYFSPGNLKIYIDEYLAGESANE